MIEFIGLIGKKAKNYQYDYYWLETLNEHKQPAPWEFLKKEKVIEESVINQRENCYDFEQTLSPLYHGVQASTFKMKLKLFLWNELIIE